MFQRRFAQRLVQASRAKGFGQKLPAFKGFTPAELAPLPPSTSEPRTGLGMGEHCELMAKEWGITREAQDLLAYESHKKAAAAYDEGFMDDLVVPCAGVFRDNNIRGGHLAGENGGTQARFRPVGQGHDHGRQFDAADRRGLDRPPCLGGMGDENGASRSRPF